MAAGLGEAPTRAPGTPPNASSDDRLQRHTGSATSVRRQGGRPGGLCPAPKGSIHPTKGPRGDLDPTPQPAGTRAQVPVHGASVPTPQLLLPLHVGTQGSHISWPPLPVQEGGLGAPLTSQRAPRKRHLLKAHILRAPVPQTGRDGPL